MLSFNHFFSIAMFKFFLFMWQKIRKVFHFKNYLNLSRKNPAFSLIELIVVIAILAIIVVIAMGDYGFAAKQARLQVASEELVSALSEALVNSQTSAGIAGLSGGGQNSAPRCFGVIVGTDSLVKFLAWDFNVDNQTCVFNSVLLERDVFVDLQVQVDKIHAIFQTQTSSDSNSVIFVFEPPDGDLVVYSSLSEVPFFSLQEVDIDLSYSGSSNKALSRTVKVVPATGIFDIL